MPVFGDIPHETPEHFLARTGVDRDEHLQYMDELKELAKKIGLGEITKRDGLLSSAISPFSLFQTRRNCNKLGIDILDFYKLNEHGLRSDSFIKHSDGDASHILFAGCSITFGDGMPLDYLWPYKVYKELKEELGLSGYFNIARNGASTIEILSQVISYIYTFGMPSMLFIMLPENTRDAESNNFASQEIIDNTAKLMYNSISKMCDLGGSKLVLFSWDLAGVQAGKHSLSNEKHFYHFDDMYRAQHMFDYTQKNKNSVYSNFFMYAMDMSHPGIAEQDFYTKFIIDIVRGYRD